MRTIPVAIGFAIVTQFSLAQSPVKVPDSATAVSIAEKRFAEIYGKKVIDAERPFSASLSEGVWHVGGTLYCGKDRTSGPGMCLGGVAMADIRQRDGKVLRTGHGK